MANSPVPRLKDVAKAAGVSLAAASRILRGDDQRFGEETRKRVLEASQQLGWRRNLLVNGMQTGHTKTVGVMIPPFDSFWVNILSGIHDTLTAADYLPITVWTGNLDQMPHFEKDEAEGLRQINRLLDRRVDGLIMWPPFSEAWFHHFPEFVERRVPVTVIDHYSTVADSVETDEQHSAEAVADHLLALGHRRIACLSSRETPSQSWAVKRRTSFEAAVKRYPDAIVKSRQLNPQGSNGLEVARQILTDELGVTAVFAVSDHEAMFVYQAASELGLKIPGDLSVVGFADLNFAATVDPPLTTVRQKPFEIGCLAAKQIMERIAGDIGGASTVVNHRTTLKVSADLIVRASTSAPRR